MQRSEMKLNAFALFSHFKMCSDFVRTGRAQKTICALKFAGQISVLNQGVEAGLFQREPAVRFFSALAPIKMILAITKLSSKLSSGFA